MARPAGISLAAWDSPPLSIVNLVKSAWGMLETVSTPWPANEVSSEPSVLSRATATSSEPRSVLGIVIPWVPARTILPSGWTAANAEKSASSPKAAWIADWERSATPSDPKAVLGEPSGLSIGDDGPGRLRIDLERPTTMMSPVLGWTRSWEKSSMDVPLGGVT